MDEPYPISYIKPGSEELSLLQSAYRDDQITWLKVIQDLHSGNIFTAQGKLVIDLIGLVLIFLAISGFIIWLPKPG